MLTAMQRRSCSAATSTARRGEARQARRASGARVDSRGDCRRRRAQAARDSGLGARRTLGGCRHSYRRRAQIANSPGWTQRVRVSALPRWLILLVLGCVLLASGCGGGDDESAGSAADVDCRVPPDTAVAMYVGWAIWQELDLSEKFGDDDMSEDAKIPNEIKADEDLGFPPEDLGIPPGNEPFDNDLERFYYAIDSMDREQRTLERLDAWAM